jgi:Nitrile hydratase beta subunit
MTTVPATSVPMPADPRFAAGDIVRTRRFDPDHHTRLPAYARGQWGEIVDVQGAWPVADAVARGHRDVEPEPVYTVRFAARDLWGEGDHLVTLHMWESYLLEVS